MCRELDPPALGSKMDALGPKFQVQVTKFTIYVVYTSEGSLSALAVGHLQAIKKERNGMCGEIILHKKCHQC